MNKELILKLKENLERIMSFFNVDYKIEVIDKPESNSSLTLAIETKDASNLLIGKNGETLKALESIIRLMAKDLTTNIFIDINNYRQIKDNHLVDLAKRIGDDVRNTKRAIALDPMNPYERRIIHTSLAPYSDLITESVGLGSKKRVVIKPRSSIS